MTGFLKRFWSYILIILIVLAFFYPIFKGQIPFWNPYNFSGNPQMANLQTAVISFIILLLTLILFKKYENKV